MGAALAIQGSSRGSGYAAPPGVRRLSVGGRRLLFHEARRHLFELNDTADVIWRTLAGGAAPDEAASALTQLGLTPAEARRFVEDAARAWMLGGQLVPAAAYARLGEEPCAQRTLGLDELAVRLNVFDPWAAEALEAVFGHLHGPARRSPRRLDVAPGEGLYFLFLDGEPVDCANPGGLAAAVKALLTELYTAGVEGAFLAHGALLTRGEATVFLTGRPGAGKTTLTLALAAAGWAYGGDDIVRFDDQGLARAAPFAAAVKSGAWPLLAPLWPRLEDAPVWLRADGQQARYLLPRALADRRPRPLRAVLLLDRQDVDQPELRPIEPLEALTEILDSAYSPEARLGAAALEALAGRVQAAACRRFIYRDLAQAVAAIEDLTHETA